MFATVDPTVLISFESTESALDVLFFQRRWLNAYNARCRAETGSRLLSQGKQDAYDWLAARTQPIDDVPIWTSSPSSAGARAVSVWMLLLPLVFAHAW